MLGACAIQPRACMNNYNFDTKIVGGCPFSLLSHNHAAAVMAATTEVLDPQVIVDGDIVLLHCPDILGVVYSKPFG